MGTDVRQAPIEQDAEEWHDVVEFTSSIRERSVMCRWSNGSVTGDPELMGRLSRVSLPKNWTAHPSSVAKAISSVVAGPVTIRIVGDRDDRSAEPTSPTPCSCGDSDVLGDYWLG